MNMRLTMADRKSLTHVFVERYRYASKREKNVLLNEFIEYTGFNRNYAARILRKALSCPETIPPIRRRRRIYDPAAKTALEKLWRISDYLCGKRLVAVIPELMRKCARFHEFEIDPATQEKLTKISAATIDRLLAPDRRKLGRKGSSMTKGTSYLIDRIPVKTFTEWKDSPAGCVQMDLVAHNGGNVYGGFLYTLDATDIHTSWTVCTLIRDKTMPEMLKALDAMMASFPFPLRSIHSDNGSEFINDFVLAFAKNHQLVFTRGRPYKKNDNPHVEQKNNSILRRNTGYLRYDKPEHAEVLQELYGYLNLYVNYFQPTMILREKHRIGAKATRKYDTPRTPYQRILDSTSVSLETKALLCAAYDGLNPADLKRKINDCQSRLIRMAAPLRAPLEVVKVRRKKEVKHTVPKWRRELAPTNPNPFLERQMMEELRRATEKIDEQRRSLRKKSSS